MTRKEKDLIWARSQVKNRTAIKAHEKEKAKRLQTNLPSRSKVNTAIDNIDNMNDAKAFLHRLSDVVYDLAKDD